MMTQNQVASLYRQTSTHGVSRVGLVVKLYDAIIEDLRQAHEAISAGQIERRVGSVNHAMLIMGELEGVLDFERGGEVAPRLKGFYQVTRAMLVEANAKSSQEMFDKLIGYYMTLRQAWEVVDDDVASGKIELPPDFGPRRHNASQTQSVPQGADSEITSRGSWSL